LPPPQRGDVAALRRLLDRNPRLSRAEYWYTPAAHFAVRQGHLEAVQLLGATISARDDEYRSTPLAWAARTNASQMVESLLTRGAPTSLPDDEPWATALAWAERRHHAETASILRRHGAER
jgi:ankyrin repeat protein